MNTSAKPHLSAIYRYPVKSMAGESLSSSQVSPLGLPYDRMWMVAKPGGRMLTGRDCPDLVRVCATPSEAGVSLAAPGRETLFVPNSAFTVPVDASVWSDSFSAWQGAEAADEWISSFVGTRLHFMWTGAASARRVRLDPAVPLSFADGFPLLLIGQASLDDLCSRVGRPLSMGRFRPNLVLAGLEPYGEDRLRRIRIGTTTFRIVKPCERCVFTTVDPETGQKSLDQEPLRTLAKYRRTPDGVIFGQNVIAEGVSELTVGMEVEVLE